MGDTVFGRCAGVPNRRWETLSMGQIGIDLVYTFGF